MVIPEEKQDLLDQATEKVSTIRELYEEGVITDGERYNQIVDVWSKTTKDVADQQWELLSRDKEGFNPVYMMADSGARGSREQIKQLSGMRGLMQKPTKQLGGQEVIENPITSCFREGLNEMEYFISSHGARKGLADTALKTADAGYLTRRLVDVAQELVVTIPDCGTTEGIDISAFKDGDDTVIPLEDRLLGRVPCEDIKHPISDEIIVTSGSLIEERDLPKITAVGIEHVKMRSVLTCDAPQGVCAKCYGRMLSSGRPVDMGEAVGILAAQSIGEPGTQLTLRTFHIGGTAARIAAQTARKSKVAGRAQFERITVVETPAGERIVTSCEGEIVMLTKEGSVRSRLAVPYGASLAIEEDQHIEPGDLLFSWDPYSEPIVSDVGGRVKFIDIVEDQTVREELDESTGRRQLVITEDREKRLHPMIEIWEGDEKKREFIVPVGAQLTVRDSDVVEPGSTLAKISREVYKTRDITGGLPRVAELFEARKPKEPAVITEIDGTVSFGDIKRGKREIIVTPPQGAERVYEVPVGKHLRVHEADQVRAGDRLSEGPVNPHDILRIKGPRAVQEYLLNEVQEVYRLQGVKISDKHIGVIVRQMLQKVRITDGGDSEFLEGEHVDRSEFRA